MSTSVSLNSAISGLNAAQAMLDTISNNISNASTPGYTAKTQNVETQVIAGSGVGVEIGTITRNVNLTLQKELTTQTSVNQAASVLNQYLQQLQGFNGSSSSQSSLSSMVGNLQNAFTALSASPNDPTTQGQVLQAAQQVASTFNTYSSQLQQMRNDTQGQISSDVATVNTQLQTIAALNKQIAALQAQGQSVADLQDQRDEAVSTIAQYMQVSTFTSSNGVMTVMTQGGQTLADTTAQQLSFSPTTLSATSASAAGLFIGGASGTALATGSLGGEMGALFTLRDTTLPTYQAQIDTAAQTLASRLNTEGIALFTAPNGTIPAANASTGFAAVMQVNQNIAANTQLLQSGTAGFSPPAGSNSFINNVLQYAFGANSGQTATGTANISGAGTLFSQVPGLTQTNQEVGDQDVAAYSPDLSAGGVTLPSTFTIDVGAGPQTVSLVAGDTATSLVSKINAAAGANVASLSGGGNLILNNGGDITLGAGTLGTAGLAALGFTAGTQTAQNPAFTVQVGGNNPVTVTISPTDTPATLLATLNGIPGLSASITGGVLSLSPTQGGSLALQNVTGTPLNALGINVTNVAWANIPTTNLGASGTLSSGLSGNASITGYVNAALASQAQDASTASNNQTTQSAYFSTLSQQQSNTSGVNIDDQLAELTQVQTAYQAAAQMVTTTEKLLDTFINSLP